MTGSIVGWYESNAYLVIAVSVCVVTPFLYLAYNQSKEKRLGLPPGPTPLPILGNLLSLGSELPVELLKLSNKYGGIYRLWLADKLAIVITDPSIMREALTMKQCSGRPCPKVMAYVHNLPDLERETSPYGFIVADDTPEWKSRRSILHSKLLRPAKIKAAIPVEVNRLIQRFDQHAESGEAVNLAEEFHKFAINIICVAALGMSIYSDDSDEHQDIQRLLKALYDCTEITSQPFISEFLPMLKFLDSKRLNSLKLPTSIQYEILTKAVEYHRSTLDSKEPRDIIDEYLIASPESNDTQALSVILAEIFAAGTTTTSHALEWLISELTLNPEYQARVRSDIKSHYQNELPVDLNVNKAPLLEATIRESMRLHPPAPLLLPRRTTSDVTIANYNIPSGIFCNYWGISKDIPNAEKFNPDNFTDPNSPFSKMYFPFGLGSRSCPGVSLADLEIRSVLIVLLQRFEFTECHIDMRPHFGIVMHPETPPKVYVKKL